MNDLVFRLEAMLGNPTTYTHLFKNMEDTASGDAVKKSPSRSNVSAFLAIFVGIFALCFGLATMLIQKLSLFSPKQAAPVRIFESSNVRVSEEAWTPEARTTEVQIIEPSPNRLSIGFGNDAALDVLARKPDVKDLQFLNCRLTEKGIAKMLPLKLDKLTIHGTTITPDGLKVLCQLKSLKHLTIKKNPDANLAELKHFEGVSLQNLLLEDTAVFDETLEFLENQKDLDTVLIARSPNFTGAAVNFMTGPKFRHLEVFDLPAMPDSTFARIAALKPLRFLALKDNYFQEGRTNVETVIQASPTKPPYDLAAFEKITSMSQLDGLALDCDRMQDAHYDSLSSMKKIGALTLSGHRYISPKNIEKLKDIPNLKLLRVIGTCLERVGLQKVCSIKYLRRITLCDSDLSDNDLSVFEKSNVGALFILGQNTISDRGLIDHLSKMKMLTLLKLPRVSFITSAGTEEFKRLKPGCQIDYK